MREGGREGGPAQPATSVYEGGHARDNWSLFPILFFLCFCSAQKNCAIILSPVHMHSVDPLKKLVIYHHILFRLFNFPF